MTAGSSFSSSSPTSVWSLDGSSSEASSPMGERRDCLANGDEKSYERSSSPIQPRRLQPLPIHETRSLILRLSVLVGNLSSLFLLHLPLDQPYDDACPRVAAEPVPKEIQTAMAQVLSCLQATADSLSIDLEQAVLNKVELNRRKYPVNACKGKAEKYTAYSSLTGITKDEGQSTLNLTSKSNSSVSSNFLDRVPELTAIVRNFSKERDWHRYHLPRSLLLALQGELGELSEIFQYLGDQTQELNEEKLDKASQEVADVTIYLLQLAAVCGVDLTEQDLEKNN